MKLGNFVFLSFIQLFICVAEAVQFLFFIDIVFAFGSAPSVSNVVPQPENDQWRNQKIQQGPCAYKNRDGSNEYN